MINLPKIAIFTLIVGIILILIAPFFLTREGIISFQETGQIGDTIGGVTAPITGLIGAILVFFALKAQIDANKLIHDQFEYQRQEESYRKLYMYISSQVDLIRTDINEFSY